MSYHVLSLSHKYSGRHILQKQQCSWGYLWMFFHYVYSYLEGLPLSCQCLHPMCLSGLVKVTQQTPLAFSEYKWAKCAGEFPKSHLEIQNWLTFPQHIPQQIIHSQCIYTNIWWDENIMWNMKRPQWSRPPWKKDSWRTLLANRKVAFSKITTETHRRQ